MIVIFPHAPARPLGASYVEHNLINANVDGYLMTVPLTESPPARFDTRNERDIFLIASREPHLGFVVHVVESQLLEALHHPLTAPVCQSAGAFFVAVLGELAYR